jgi:hypothetical protein
MKTTKDFNWPSILGEFRTSGKTARLFAKENNINYHTLRYHLKKDTASHAAEGDRRIVPMSLQPAGGMKLNNGAEIRISFEEAGSVTIRISGL